MNIRIHNHIYAASRRVGGFGTFFASAGLEERIVKELEKKVSYVSAHKLPSSPTEEEIETLFPVNYAYYRDTSSNLIAVIRSKYTGRCNHTPNRFGNFISNSIIFENIDSLNIPVVFDNFKFRGSLTVEEEENFTEDISDLLIDNSKIDYNHYLECVKKNKKRLNAILKIVDLLIDGWFNETSKKITLLGNKEENEHIIFALYTLFPPALINKYSFATYVNNPNKYPFQITGIIKETGITCLDSKYFHLIEIDNLADYQIQNDFTNYFRELIMNDKYNFDILSKELTEISTNDFDKSLNLIAKYHNFVDNIGTKSIDDYKEITASDTQNRIKNKIIAVSKRENPSLFIDIISYLFTQRNFSDDIDFRECFNRFYEIYFDDIDQDHRSDYFYDFYSKIKENTSLNNESVLSIYYLNDFTIDNKSHIGKELLIVNDFLENNEIEAEELYKLIIKYDNYIDKNDMFNLFKNKKRLEFERLLKEEKLEQLLTDGSDDFKELNNKIKVQILSDLLWSKNIKNEFDLTFSEFKKIVNRYIERPPEFWIKFFSTKFNQGTDQRYSLSYLKRNFVINSIHEEFILHFIVKINLDGREKWWIIDYISENNILLENKVEMHLRNWELK